MWKAALVGALALATIDTSLALADGANESLVPRGPGRPAAAAGDGVYRTASAGPASQSRIAQFKTALRLTAEQERHWPAVEAALRDMIHRYEADEARAGGMLQRIGNRATVAMFSASALKRLVAAAQPLIKSLDQGQKRDALQLARAMGLADVASRFE